MKHLLVTTILSLGLCSTAQAALDITIQPSADGNDIVWTVSWDSLEGNGSLDPATYDWDAMNPATGNIAASDPWGLEVREVLWIDVGDPFGAAYVDGSFRGFGDGAGGVVSTPGGWGVGPDDDGIADDLFIFNTQLNGTDPFPTSGSFVLTVPGANLHNYNLGTYTSNPNVTIRVLDTPLSPIPEPSSFALLGLGCLTFAGIARRRKC